MAPRKIRLVTNLVKNMTPADALAQLKFLPKYAALPVYELLKSAMASCKENNLEMDNVYIKSFTCDAGPALKRRRFKSRGRTHGIKKRMSHINLLIAEKEASKTKLQPKTSKNKDIKVPAASSKPNNELVEKIDKVKKTTKKEK